MNVIEMKSLRYYVYFVSCMHIYVYRLYTICNNNMDGWIVSLEDA